MGRTFKDREKRNREDRIHRVERKQRGKGNAKFIREWTHDKPYPIDKAVDYNPSEFLTEEE